MAETIAVPMIASWLMIVLLLVVVIGVGCLMSARMRIVGVVLLALLAFGFFSVRVQVHQSAPPAPRIVALEQHGPITQIEQRLDIVGNLHDAQEHARQAAAAAKAASARAQAEIVRNQRLMARLGDAIVQESPNGNILETYPDGMQVKQNFAGHREIVREADGDSSFQSAPIVHASGVKLWILGAPLLALIVAFVALRSRPRAAGYGLAIAAAGVLAMVFIGYLSQSSSRVYIPEGVEVRTVTPTDAAPVDHGELIDIQAHGAEVAQSAPRIPSATSIEEAWTKLTGPKIRLDNDVAERTVSHHELAAAKTVLTTTAPGVDPITQTWLASVAKATLQALAEAQRAREEHSAPGSMQSVGEALSHHEASATVEANAGKPVAAAKGPEEPRPEWLNDTPKMLMGNSRRMVVSSDPFLDSDLAWSALREELRRVVHARLTDVVEAANGGSDAQVPGLEQLGITDQFIESELFVEEPYLETVHLSVGPMKRAHALVEFADAKDRLMLERWIVYAQRESIDRVGRLSLLAVGGLGLVFGLLKVDTWTRGYYTKRLFIGVPAAIIAVVLYTLA
jgi:hypothetical protein